MPIRTQMLDSGNFVYSPKLPASPALSEYLSFANQVMRQWREVQEACDRSPFSEELRRRKAQIDETFKSFVETFKPHFSLRPVRHDPTFVPVSQFFQGQHPIRDPFSILHCELELPLHTVHDFPDHHALAQINAALAEEAIFPWWQTGPHGQPCYLFGAGVWELKPSEAARSSEGIVLSLQELSEKHRQAGRVSYGPSVTGATSANDFIPERLRILAWRATGGTCSNCRGCQSLQFDHIKPLRPGMEPAADNIEVLCDSCYRKKHALD